jgi:hypothetical protein
LQRRPQIRDRDLALRQSRDFDLLLFNDCIENIHIKGGELYLVESLISRLKSVRVAGRTLMLTGLKLMGSFDLQYWTRIGAMNLSCTRQRMTKAE